MRVIGLTGGIACGKSNISDALRGLGAVIVDGDLLSRELTAPGGAALPGIRQDFGDQVFHTDGTLDRRALGSAVFGNPEALERLNRIMRPLLRGLIRQRMDGALAAGAAVCVLDMPLLYEEGLDSWCDTVWCAALPPDEQLRRLMARDGLTQAQALSRIGSQLSAQEKARRADVVIDTSGTIAQTRALIPALYQRELIAAAQEGESHAAVQP